jgi:YVTN family beta-propeller protein
MRLGVTFATALLAMAPLAVQAEPAGTPPAYSLVRSTTLGSPERWDYVVFDPLSDRVFVAHGDRVDVVDGKSGAALGQVVGMPGGSHGIGISAETGKGFTDDGDAGEAVAFDLKTFKTLAHIKAKPDADGVVYDPSSRHIFVLNGESDNITVIDPATNAAVATIEGGGALEYAVTDGAGHLFVDGAENKEIIRVDTRSNAVDAHWAMPQCVAAHGLAIDVAAHRLFASCANGQLIVMNADTGAVVASKPIGQGSDAVAFDPHRKLILSSNGDGTLSIIKEINPDTYEVKPPLVTRPTARTMAIDPASGRLYIAAADIDVSAPVKPRAGGRPGRAQPLPGTLKLMVYEPSGQP